MLAKLIRVVRGNVPPPILSVFLVDLRLDLKPRPCEPAKRHMKFASPLAINKAKAPNQAVERDRAYRGVENFCWHAKDRSVKIFLS